MKRIVVIMVLGLILLAAYAWGEEVTFTVNAIDENGVGNKIGTITLMDSRYGLLIEPRLSGLTPGIHGFHVHQNPDCGPGIKNGKKVAGLAAGGHYDPTGSKKHMGPYGEGHLGDLPALYVDKDGTAALTLLAPRLKVSDLKGRAIIIHSAGDNYSDNPKSLGGGGSRAACGVIK